MNVERLLAVKQAILDHPEQVRMETWFSPGRGSDLHHDKVPDLLGTDCGTAGCIAGWAATLFANGQRCDDFGSVMDMADDLLGITRDLHCIYSPPVHPCYDGPDPSWPEDLRQRYYSGPNGSVVRAQAVAERIDRFLLEHGAVIPEPARASLGEPAPESSGVR